MVDIYTKSVLTVIAAALVTMVAQQAIRPSAAQIGGTQRVQICDCYRIVSRWLRWIVRSMVSHMGHIRRTRCQPIRSRISGACRVSTFVQKV